MLKRRFAGETEADAGQRDTDLADREVFVEVMGKVYPLFMSQVLKGNVVLDLI